MGVRQMSVPLGGAVAALTLPPMAISGGWRFSLFVAGLIALAIGVVVLFLYREPANVARSISRSPERGVRGLTRRKDIWAGLIYAFVLSGGQWCFLTYVELYLNEIAHMTIPLAASLLALGQVTGTASRVGWGFVSDRMFSGKRKPVLLLVGSLALLMILFVSFVSPATPFWIVAVVIGLLGATVMGWNGIFLALISELAGLRVAGSAIGLGSTFAFLGIVVVPPIFGFLVDAGFSYRFAWIVLAVFTFLPLVFLQWIQEER
jgi:sugar phosphate permease